MSKLHEIPIVVTNAPARGGLSARSAGPATSAMLAILNEIEAKLETLATNGRNSTIDLRWLIGSKPDLDLLRNALGVGEVAATITAAGNTDVQETAVPCVWWVTHSDYDGQRLGEFIEITEVPELLRSDRLAISQGLAGLRARCAQIETDNPFSSVPSTSRSQ